MDRPRWAEYDFGGVRIGFGQNHSSVQTWISNQLRWSETGPVDEASAYNDRKDMMRLIWGGFRLSLIETNIGTDVDAANVDIPIPKIEARYDLPYAHGHFAFLGGLNTYTLTDTRGDENNSITSWIFGLSGIHKFGPIYFNWDTFYTQNYSDYGLPSFVGHTDNGANIHADHATGDTNTFGGLGAFGISVNESMRFELGLGYRQDENPEAMDNADPTMNVYGQLPITLVNGFFIIPEIGYYSFMEDGNGEKEGDLLYVGAKWHMDF